MKPSPRPWELQLPDFDWAFQRVGGGPVGECYGKKSGPANAAFIVAAVNAHDHLIAALEAVLMFSNDPHVIEIAKKALAVAGAR